MLAGTRQTTAANPTTAATNAEPSGLLVYDGDCGFCTAAARWLEARLRTGSTTAPWQSLDLEEFDLTEAQVSSAAYWVRDGQSYRGADGIAQALQQCRPGWRIVGVLAARPPLLWIARALYPLVARYRYRLPGSTDACRLDGT